MENVTVGGFCRTPGVAEDFAPEGRLVPSSGGHCYIQPRGPRGADRPRAQIHLATPSAFRQIVPLLLCVDQSLPVTPDDDGDKGEDENPPWKGQSAS